jgi:hypothetical protein
MSLPHKSNFRGSITRANAPNHTRNRNCGWPSPATAAWPAARWISSGTKRTERQYRILRASLQAHILAAPLAREHLACPRQRRPCLARHPGRFKASRVCATRCGHAVVSSWERKLSNCMRARSREMTICGWGCPMVSEQRGMLGFFSYRRPKWFLLFPRMQVEVSPTLI